jgi:DNA-directed RNA polymerase subunit H (RpoH/RPB5)
MFPPPTHPVLAEDAIKAALKDYKLKQEKLRGEEAVAQ